MKLLVLLLSCVSLASTALAADTLSSLVRVAASTADAQVQLDVLRGLRDAMQGRSGVPMPAGWEATEAGLLASPNPEVRAMTRTLGLAFGSKAAVQALRTTLTDASLDAAQRQDALRALASVRDETLPATLRSLLTEPAVRGAAVRALAAYDQPENASAALAAFAQFSGSERRDALNMLAARASSARALLAAVEANTIPARELTADLVRQLRNLKDDAVLASLTRAYGSFRDVGADKQAEIDRYKGVYRAGGSTPGDAIRGRTVYARICQQCHSLFDVGGKVGPDLTGSARSDLDYILQNIVDPNAVIPNEYRAATLELKDGRVVTGIVKHQDDQSVVVATATETIAVPRAEVTEMAQSQLSMMPEGLLTPLSDQEFRDLVYYLGRPGQTPLLATADTANLFFNGHDLALWQGDESVWSVDQGDLVGRAPANAREPFALLSDMIANDFRLVFEVRPGTGPGGAGLLVRADPSASGAPRGYRIGLDAATWGTVQEQGGRGPLAKPAASPARRDNEWNTVEVVAVGSRLLVAINGTACVDLNDTAGPRQGIIAFQLDGAGATVRVRRPSFEPQSKAALSTPAR